MAQLVVLAVVAAVETASFIYRLLNRPKARPPVADLQVASAIQGAPIPFGYGRARIAGTLIWTPGLYFTVAGIPGTGGLFTPDATQYLYFANFAFLFCEGPAAILRMWADEKLIYDNSPGTSEFPAADYPPWNPATLYNIGDIVSYLGLVYTCTQQNTNIFPGQPAIDTGGILYWSQLGSYQPFTVSGTYGPGDVVISDGQLYVNIQSTSSPAHTPSNDHYWRTLRSYYGIPTIYPGTQTQLPDPDIQANEGVANTPAFRGTCYAKFKAFPLANFGNRIPSIRAEIAFGAARGPYIVQQNFVQNLEPSDPTVSIGLPIETTDFLLACGRWNQDETPSAVPTISDTAGNTWTLLYADDDIVVAYCDAPLASSGTDVSFVYNGSLFPYNADAYVVHVRGFNSYAKAIADGTASPAAVTLGPISISVPTGGSTHWVAALFTFTDAQGGTMTLAPLFWADPAHLPPDTFDFLFPAAATSWSTVLKFGIPTNTLASVVTDLCKRSGLDSSMIDVSLLTPETIFPNDIVDGDAITRPMAAAEAIKTLFQSFIFDACETDGTLKFVPRGLDPVLTIPEDDLGLLEDGAKVKPEEIAQAQDLLYQVNVFFNDLAMAYQQGKQLKQRSSRIIKTKQQQTLELPLTMAASRARQIAEKTLFLSWLERSSYVTNLWRAIYCRLDPTDVIEFVYGGQTFQIRITECLIGQGFVVKINGVGDNANNYQSAAPGSSGSGFTPQPLPIAGPTILFLLDIPLIRDGDSNPGGTGWYAAMSSALVNWVSASLYRSSDNANFALLDVTGVPAPFGYASNALGAPRSPWTWDRLSSLTVKMSVGTLEAASALNVLNGSNAAIYGDPTSGNWEIIQFQTPTLNPDGTYTITTFLRGRRGTEGNCGSHANGELFILLPAGTRRENDALALLNQSRYYEAVTSGQGIDPTESQQFKNTGNDLRPYAVTSVAGARDGSNNLTVTWIRRTRIGGDWLDGVGTVPLSEDSEAYEIDIYNGLTVVRTLSGLSSPTASYSAADQTTDFGSPQAAIAVKIYQISGEVGRGFAKSVTV